MKLPLILSAVTFVSAVRVPNTWPQQANQNPNLNDVNRDGQQIRQDGRLAQQVPNYNGINPFINNLANIPPSGLIAPGNIFSNLPDYNNWFGGVAPNQGYGANLINNINPVAQQPNLQTQRNYNGNPNVAGQYNQQRQNPTVQRPNVGARRDPSPYREVQGQVPFITYTTQRSAPQAAPFNNIPPAHGQGQRANVNQAFPQANPTAAPITEIDFSPLDPFPHGQQDFQATNPNNMFDTTQLLNNFDPFSQHPQLNGYPDSQPPQRNNKVPFNKPLLAVTDNRYNPAVAAKTLNFNPFKQNYRDHRTHEPTFYDPDYDTVAVPKPKRLEHEKAPIVNNHEYPAEVPTRPIYPGEAQWAKPGVKHRPFVSKQQYKNLDETNEHPDGHDTFLEAQKLFEKQQQQFGLRSKQLSKENNSPPESVTRANDEGDVFVPTRLYAQVRHSEDEKHLPPQTDGNGRLKELVKDSKIQTIYSEEGYEDSAYDHAGHEKKAENTEGFESDEKNKEVKTKKKIPEKKIERKSSSYAVGDQNLNEDTIEKLKKEDITNETDDEDSNEDSEPAGTHYDEKSYLNKVDSKDKDIQDNIIKSKDIKVVTAKDKGGGKIEMEISSEVKAVRQPNNSTKIHKYVKIYPKVKESLTSMDKMSENEISTSYKEKEVEIEADRRSLTVDPTEIFIEEIIAHTSEGSSSEEYISTTVAPTEYSEIVTMEIPITTQPTTSIPKAEHKHDESLENADTSDLNLKPNVRRKRSSDGIPEIEIDTDFIDKINHDLGKPTEKSKEPDEKKYPYYNTYKLKGLHQDSPLRYAEDLKTVPKKTEGKLAFYALADRKMACSDVNPEVDPVPDRIKDADESVENDEEADEDNDPAKKGPRLGQLGDKIDCFKVKYFGENPLDNPIFQEELVGPVQPIFSEIETISKKKIEPVPTGKEPLNSEASSYNANNEIEEGKKHKYGLKSWFPGKGFGLGENTERDTKFVNHFVERNPNLKINAELLSQQSKAGNNGGETQAQNIKESAGEVLTPPTLITTPKYSIDLKPKHIYDQIQLLNYLPEEEFEEIKKAIEADLPKLNKTEMTTFMPNTNKTEPVISAPVAKKKKSDKKNADRRAKALKNSEASMRMETSDDGIPESLPEIDALQLIRKKPRKPLYQIFDVNKFIPNAIKIPPVSRNSNPNYYAPVSINTPAYQIFDINKYLPTTPFPVFKNFAPQSTVLPKYKVFSEVFYKEDIKPNEQLNVFTDVLKHIDSFPKLKDSFSESSDPISVKLDTKKISEKFPQSMFDETQTNEKDFFSTTVTTLMTTFDSKTYASNHRYPPTENPLSAQKQIEDMLNAYGSTKKPKRRRRIKTTTQETPVVIEESTSTLHFMGENTDVMGLMPPIIQGYKTIYHPKRDNNQHISNPTIMIKEKKINTYYVQGMRPPPKQKVYLYSDFLTDNHIMQRISKPLRNRLRRRSKRNAQRPAYAEVTRNRNKTETAPEGKKDEADDYVPHRSKNYHYDEKTGKIVYDKKPEEQNKEDEIVEYIEVVEEPPKTTEKPKQNPVFATATPPPVGQSYTDFVKLLKSASNYHEIPDPTTTEKGAEPVTQKIITSTLPTVATKPPEFLSILAKVRNDSNYKVIEEKKKTTTAKPVEQEEESAEEESQVDDIRNSPGGYEGYEARANWEIFDITDFLPNIKSYLPKTAVDTSKYKTIERPQVRHSLSSRYNSEEEKNLQNVNTNKRPILTQKGPGQERVQVTTLHPETIPPRPTRLQRRRTTTPKTIQDDVTGAPEEESTQVQNDGTKKRRRRRRRKRIKVIPNAEEGQESAPDTTKKVVRRRTERESHIYSEGNEQYEQIIEDLPDVPAATEDYVDFEIPENYNTTEDGEQPDNLSLVAEKFVDVFKNYDKDKKHGGNYRKEDEVNKTIIVVAPETPETVSKTEKPVVVFKAYDEQKKHGGNYKKEDEVNKTLTVAAPQVEDKTKKPIEVFKDYDKSKKHGGNYKAEKDAVKTKDQVKPVTVAPDPKDVKKVEEFKEYDKTKKHGGNYRPEPEKVAVNEQEESGLKKAASIQVANVNVFQDYDKTKKHGGNYKAEEEDVEKTKEQMKPIIIEADPVDDKNVEEFKEYDKTQKHGGNYRPEPEEASVSEQDESGLVKTASIQVANVNVFQDYDKDKKHGGNYKAEKDAIVNEQVKPVKDEADPKSIKKVEVFKEYDKTKKHGGNYKAEKEEIGKEPVKPINVENDSKKVEEIKEFDKTKRHGGNYRPEPEQGPVSELDESGLLKTASIQIANVNVFQDYDKTKKHGGNYKSESESIEKPSANIELEKTKDVEVFKDFDETKQHGGNYKPESGVVQEQQLEESQLGKQQVKQNSLNDDSGKKDSVEVFKDYDKTKKHGGNYMKEDDAPEKATLSKDEETSKVEDVETFKKYDEEQKTGGNYKRQEEFIEPKAEATYVSKAQVSQAKRYVESRNDVQRLADVVLKPEAFYTDLKLPLDINALKITKDLPNEELEEIVKSEEVDKSKEQPLRRNDNVEDVVVIGNKMPQFLFQEPLTTTKKPLFIKDPSKRLYFYAPLR